jgi:hypothetical protein
MSGCWRRAESLLQRSDESIYRVKLPAPAPVSA